MTWSITPPMLRGGNPVVRWNGEPLGKLPHTGFVTAIRSAFALGNDLIDCAADYGSQRISTADKASMIIAAVAKEMDRRNIQEVPERDLPTPVTAQPQESEHDR